MSGSWGHRPSRNPSTQGSWGRHLSRLSGSHFADEGTQVNSGEVSSSWPFQAACSWLEEKAGRAPLSAESHSIPKGHALGEQQTGSRVFACLTPYDSLLLPSSFPRCKGRAAGLLIAACGLWLLSERSWQETRWLTPSDSSPPASFRLPSIPSSLGKAGDQLSGVWFYFIF